MDSRPDLVEVDRERQGAVGGVGEERDERGRGGGRGRRVGGGGGGGEEVEVGEEAVGPAAGGAAGGGARRWRPVAPAEGRLGEGERRGVGPGQETVDALHCRRRRRDCERWVRLCTGPATLVSSVSVNSPQSHKLTNNIFIL